MDAMQRASFDLKRCAAVFMNRSDRSAHLRKRRHDALHRTLLDRSVAGDRRIKRLSGENAGEQPYSRAAVSCVDDAGRPGEPMQPFSVNDDRSAVLLN